MTASSTDPDQRPERRAGERTEILGDLHGEVMIYQPMAIRDISQGGALIESSFPLQIDSLHELRLELGDAAVILRGRVVHCSIADMDREFVSYRSGIEFTQPSAAVQEVISQFIAGLRAGRSGQGRKAHIR